jgi:hypothetical protein
MFTEFFSCSRGLRTSQSSREDALAWVKLNRFAVVTVDIFF